MKNFDIFLPEKFPRNQLQVDLFAGIQLDFSEITGYGKQEISNLAEFFGFDKVQLLREWEKFLQLVYSNKAIWSSIYNQPTAIFWSTILCEFEEIPILTQKQKKLNGNDICKNEAATVSIVNYKYETILNESLSQKKNI